MRAIPVFFSKKLLGGSYSRSAGQPLNPNPSRASGIDWLKLAALGIGVVGKPKFVVESWRRAALPIHWHRVIPATVDDLCLAHHPRFVSSILAGTARNGFGNHRLDVARSLPFTTGAMLNAANAALECGIACAPVSGFHHAGYSTATMFCTFNGLMVAAVKLLHSKQVKRILVLDLEQHYGDGTDEIKQTLRIKNKIVNATFGRFYDRPSQASLYLLRLRIAVKQFPKFDLILYQAGADLHVDDPLGGVLNSDQMRERDSIVFEAARRSRVPLAWNLAGGYQDPISKVVRIHTTTMEECVRCYVANS